MFYLKLIKMFLLIIRYRLIFFFGFIPYLSFFRLFLNVNSKSQAKRIVAFLQAMGPSFIKLGQTFSVRNDLIGKVFAEELSSLQENTINTSFCKVEKVLEEALNTNINNVFKSINKKAIASASIASVYQAELYTNEKVAIKILKPNVIKTFQHDIVFLRKLFTIAQNNVKEASRVKIVKVIDILEKNSNFELDLRFEAAAYDEMRANFKDTNILKLPKVYWKYTNRNVLITEWIEGYKLSEIGHLENIKVRKVLYNLLLIFFKQVIEFGFFHGDIHPGNIIIQKNGSIVMLDLGIMGRISNTSRKYILEVWSAFLNKDYSKAAYIHFQAGWVSTNYDIEDFTLAVRAIIDSIFADEENVSIGNLMEQLFEVTRMFGMEIQSELLLLQKNMFLLEGMFRNTDVNIWLIAKEILNNEDFTQNIGYRISSNINEFTYKVNKSLNSMLETSNLFKEALKCYLKYDTKRKYNKLNYVIICFVILILVVIWNYYGR